MNEIIKSLNNRKSVREYLAKEIPQDIKTEILNAALQAPTAGNMCLYTIIDVTDQAIKDKLVYSCDNQPFIAKAPLVLVFCADYYRWHKAFGKYNDKVRDVEEGDLLLANQDALIAAQNTVVAAESFGIGSCYIGFQHFCHFNATYFSHHYIEEYERIVFEVKCQCLLCIESYIHIVTFIFKIEFQNLTQSLLIIYYQYTFVGHTAFFIRLQRYREL